VDNSGGAFEGTEERKSPMTDLLADFQTLVRETRKPEAEVMTLAFQTGLRQLWRDRTLARYLRGEISRDEAVAAAGIDWVELAERQREAMMEDLAWALGDKVTVPPEKDRAL